MTERAWLTETDGPPHDSLLHLHEHDDRPPSAVPHEHPHPVLPGEEWQHQHPHPHVYDKPALPAAVRVRSVLNASGYSTVSTAVLSPEGTLQVTARFAAIYGSDQVIGYQCTLMEARLNGALVTDPDRARRLAARAGIAEPAVMTWISEPQARLCTCICTVHAATL